MSMNLFCTRCGKEDDDVGEVSKGRLLCFDCLADDKKFMEEGRKKTQEIKECEKCKGLELSNQRLQNRLQVIKIQSDVNLI